MRPASLLRPILRLSMGAAALFLAAALALVADGLVERLLPSDVAVVLGSKVFEDGTPSARLAARLDKAVRLFQSGLVRQVIVSGGTGVEGVDEAQAMKAYLVARQVPAERVWVDSEGVTTRATARNSAALMRAHGWRSALLVSQYFHLARTRLAFRQAGVDALGTAHAEFFEWRDLYSIPREVLGWAHYRWQGSDTVPAR
jgi:uncharacterized SAM-binding protein YcdF (DUF218 family)